METNPRLELAFDFLEHTGRSVFLTGKAGTGKTTFLKELRLRSPKRMIVVAPTGVAAINAGGVTIHSFFQLPFGPYIAGKADEVKSDENRFTHKFSREKINIIRSMDLLVIDEISMVRADLLDAVSDMLCRYRDRAKPFGGIQLLMIGDLQQLSPVARDEEWALLKEYYPSPYFFCSRALQKVPYVCIELIHVYRQSDPTFIDLLNRIRDNQVDQSVLAMLNARYIPDFNPDDAEGYITLTTHNYQAKQINERKLEELDTRPYTYEAEIKDDFPEYVFPTDQHLVLKQGAQVMFVKNDSSPEKRYYNGKIGRVTAISADNILVRCGEEEAIHVVPEEWTNTRYSIDSDTQEISETVVGVFKQYPLKTAWAITIHKSQGLTFEKAIVDAHAAFTHGQVYVALSRCKSLEGLVLGAPLRKEGLIHDMTVRHFSEVMSQNQPDQQQLSDSRREYYLQLLKDLFDFQSVFRRLQYVSKVFNEHLWKLYPELIDKVRKIREACYVELVAVGERFQLQLERLIRENADDEKEVVIGERVTKGISYFIEKVREKLVSLLNETSPEIDNKEVRKTVEEALNRLQQEVDLKLAVLEAVITGFSVQIYLAARAKAMIEKPKTKAKKTSAKLDVGTDILHQQLYDALRQWRKEEAGHLGLPAYTVLQQKALLGVTNTLPTNSKELLAVSGIGKKVVERYGVRLLEIVDQYRLGLASSEVRE